MTKVSLKAIELFGGAEKIKERMVDVLRKGLIKKIKTIQEKNQKKFDDIEILTAISDYLKVDSNMLRDIYNRKCSNGEVTYNLFKRLQGPLDISIHDALGSPDLSNKKIRDSWLKECHRNAPMLRAAAITNGEINVDKFIADGSITDKELDLYVTLRTLKELASE